MDFYAGINPSNDHEDWVWMQELAIRTYDLNVDQILEIVENAGPKGEVVSIATQELIRVALAKHIHVLWIIYYYRTQ